MFWNLLSKLYSCLNVKELLARSRHKIWTLSDCNWTRTQNHLVCKGTLNHCCVRSNFNSSEILVQLTTLCLDQFMPSLEPLSFSVHLGFRTRSLGPKNQNFQKIKTPLRFIQAICVPNSSQIWQFIPFLVHLGSRTDSPGPKNQSFQNTKS